MTRCVSAEKDSTVPHSDFDPLEPAAQTRYEETMSLRIKGLTSLSSRQSFRL